MRLVPLHRNWLWEPEEEGFDHFLDDLPMVRKTAQFIPPMDIYQKGNKLVVEAPIIGIDPKNVEISVKDNVLIIQGNAEKKSEIEEGNYFRKEIKSGSFYRSVRLPAHVRGDKAEASYQKGILKIEIPKIEEGESKEKKLTIKIKE